MKFWKMNGAGNDFIVIDNRDGTVDAAQWPPARPVRRAGCYGVAGMPPAFSRGQAP